MEQEYQLDLRLTTETKCEKCGGLYFKQVFMLREVPQTLSPTGKISYYPIPLFICDNCGHLNKEFEPNIPTTKSSQPRIIKK